MNLKIVIMASLFLSQIAFAAPNKDITHREVVAVQLSVKGKTVLKLLQLLSKVGVKESSSKSYDVRNMVVHGTYNRSEEGAPLAGITIENISATDHEGDYSGRQDLDLDQTKTGVQDLGNFLFDLGGQDFLDNGMHGRFGFNVPWISCYAGQDLGGPDCQVTIATQLILDAN